MAIETYWGNTVFQYAVALLIFAFTVLVIMLIKKGFLSYSARFAEKSSTLIDNAIIEMVGTVSAPFYWFASLVFALQYLHLSPVVSAIINRIFIIWFIIQAIVAFQIFIDFIISEKVRTNTKAGSAMISGILSGLIKIGLWLTALLFILSNFGVDITSLIAGLGIGGIAIALAAQSILGDLFSSIAIFFDRPFVIGDYIDIGTNSGTVQKIGIKTTRIRALSGEEIVIPNKDIAAARISNYRRMKERRAIIDVAVPYGTDSKTLEKIPALLEVSVADVGHASFRNAYLIKMGPSALIFELVYLIDDRDYELYLQAKQAILFNIVRTFAKHKIALIAPGQVLNVS